MTVEPPASADVAAVDLLSAGRWLFAGSSAGLGLLALTYQDFALQWQPVAETVPFRRQLALLNGAALLGAAVALSMARIRRVGAYLLAGMFGAWVTVLHAPLLVREPDKMGIWLGFAEAAAIFGGAVLLVNAVRRPRGGWESQEVRPLALAARLSIGAALPVFGLSHFLYPDFTASLVPGWIPAKLFWAYFTGCAHVAAGAAILTGIAARLASRLLAAMFGSWALLVHIPRIWADPANQAEWIMLCIASALTGTATLLAAQYQTDFSGHRPGTAEQVSLP